MHDDKFEEALNMLSAGMTISQIATELDVSEPTLRNAFKAHNTSMQVKKVVNEGDIVAAYTNEIPVPKILATNNISYTQLYTILARNNVPLRRSTQAQGRANALDAAVQLYVDGAPLWRIKNETGIAQPVLHAELHRRDIVLRRPRSNYNE